MIYAKEPYLLHLLAGSSSEFTALEAIKKLIDTGLHDPNEIEPEDNLSPLHVASSWDNLAICQLLIHYGANSNCMDIDKRRPLDVATGRSRRFLKKLEKTNYTDKVKLRKIIGLVFRKFFALPARRSLDFNVQSRKRPPTRRSCPVVDCYIEKLANSIINKTDQNNNNLFVIRISSITPFESTALNENALKDPDRDESSIQFSSLPTNINQVFGSYSSREKSNGDDLIEEIRKTFSTLEISTLRDLLRQKNIPFGPIDEQNRKLYESKLAKLEISETKNVNSSPGYSQPLERLISSVKNGLDELMHMGLKEEQMIRAEYSKTVSRTEVSFFCYLLIDPSIIGQEQRGEVGYDNTGQPIVTFDRFILSIFYIGKGKRSRPLQHLIDAHRCRFSAINSQRSKKLKQILSLWDRGIGVISLNIFSNIHSGEALVREGAMIEAIGLENITNLQRGTFPGVAKRWTNKKISEYGSFLLRKAHAIFINERCRPIFECDFNTTSK